MTAGSVLVEAIQAATIVATTDVTGDLVRRLRPDGPGHVAGGRRRHRHEPRPELGAGARRRRRRHGDRRRRHRDRDERLADRRADARRDGFGRAVGRHRAGVQHDRLEAHEPPLRGARRAARRPAHLVGVRRLAARADRGLGHELDGRRGAEHHGRRGADGAHRRGREQRGHLGARGDHGRGRDERGRDPLVEHGQQRRARVHRRLDRRRRRRRVGDRIGRGGDRREHDAALGGLADERRGRRDPQPVRRRADGRLPVHEPFGNAARALRRQGPHRRRHRLPLHGRGRDARPRRGRRGLHGLRLLEAAVRDEPDHRRGRLRGAVGARDGAQQGRADRKRGQLLRPDRPQRPPQRGARVDHRHAGHGGRRRLGLRVGVGDAARLRRQPRADVGRLRSRHRDQRRPRERAGVDRGRLGRRRPACRSARRTSRRSRRQRRPRSRPSTRRSALWWRSTRSAGSRRTSCSTRSTRCSAIRSSRRRSAASSRPRRSPSSATRRSR